MRWIPVLLCLLPSFAGEHLRFDLAVAPGGRVTTMHAYVFDAREETLRVVRASDGADELRSVCRSRGALAGINGGFFDSTGAPLGLVVSEGRRMGRPGLASGLTSGVLSVSGGTPSLSRAKDHAFGDPSVSDLLQAGPFLVRERQAVTELQPSRYARRSLILTDGNHRWALAYVPSATLDGIAKTLAAPGGFPPFQPTTVLNLGGATSSGFWVRRPADLDFYLREVVKLPNFVIVVPRQQALR